MELNETSTLFEEYLKALNEKRDINVNDHIVSFMCLTMPQPLSSLQKTVIELSRLLDFVTIQICPQGSTKKVILQLHKNQLTAELVRFDFCSNLFNYLVQILRSEKW